MALGGFHGWRRSISTLSSLTISFNLWNDPNFDLTFCSLYMFLVALRGGFCLFKCCFQFSWMFRHVGRLSYLSSWCLLLWLLLLFFPLPPPKIMRAEDRRSKLNCGNKQPATWSTTSVWPVGACHRNHLSHLPTFYHHFFPSFWTPKNTPPLKMWKTRTRYHLLWFFLGQLSGAHFFEVAASYNLNPSILVI